LLRSTVPMNALMVGTFRDTELDRAPLLAETLADLRRDADVERISLSGLDRGSVAAFVAAAGYDQSDDATVELAEAVHAGTEGNPFFVGEILRHLRESGDTDLGDVGLPPGVKDVVISRLTRLSASANHVLTLASVIGPRFDLPVLERLTETDADALLDALDEAVRARVIVELPAVGEYTFAHALIRQVLIGELTASRRARLHWRVTQALETMPDASRRSGELAFHATEAGAVGDVVRAAEYALAASHQALDRLAFEPAVELASRGLAVLERAPDTTGRQRAELLLAQADACNFTGGTAATKAAAKDAAAESRAVGWAEGLARAAVAYGRWVELGVVDDVLADMCADALDALPPDDLKWRARVLTTLANYEFNGLSRGVEVAPMAEECVALARQAGDDESLAWALYLHASTLASTGAIEERLELAEELVQLSQDRDDSRAKLDGLVMRGGTRLELGDIAGFRADAAELERVAARLQWWAPRWWAGNFRITEAVIEGHLDQAEAMAEEQYRRGAEDANALNAYAAQLFAIRRELGRVADLVPLMAASVAADPSLVAFRAALTLSGVDLDDLDDAAAHLDALAIDGFAALPRDVSLTSCLAMLSEAAAMLGATQHAGRLAELFAPHRGHMVVGGVGVVCFGAVDRYLGMLAACEGRPDVACSYYAEAARLEEAMGSPTMLARTHYWWGRTLIADGPEGTGRTLLESAGETADQLGMRVLSRRVQDALASA
jgi:hypothetical protein